MPAKRRSRKVDRVGPGSGGEFPRPPSSSTGRYAPFLARWPHTSSETGTRRCLMWGRYATVSADRYGDTKGDTAAEHFLNVDLDIYSTRDLQPIVNTLGEAVIVLHLGRIKRTHNAHLE